MATLKTSKTTTTAQTTTITNSVNVQSAVSNEVLLNKVMLSIEKLQNDTKEDLTVVSGDTVIYSIIISNLGGSDYKNAPFIDQLDSNLEYIVDTFKVDGVAQTPTINSNNRLFYLITSIPALGSVKIEFQVTVL